MAPFEIEPFTAPFDNIKMAPFNIAPYGDILNGAIYIMRPYLNGAYAIWRHLQLAYAPFNNIKMAPFMVPY